MHFLYFPSEEELTELLLIFFPDILSKEVLLEGYGLDSYGGKPFSGMSMKRKDLLYLHRALKVNGCITNDSKYWKNIAEKGGASNHLDSCDYPNINGSIIFTSILMKSNFKI
eukprot:15352657-Ditylum_brightwellii.AAC.1